MKPSYIIFDAVGITDQVESNYAKLRTMIAWQHSYPERLKFNNFEDVVFCASHHGLLEANIAPYLAKKLDEADNVIILASERLNIKSGILNWQVDYARRNNLPFIVAYVGLDRIDYDAIDAHASWLPVNLQKAQKEGLKIVHIPFTLDKIERACKNFSKERGVYGITGKTIY